jgi:hypothetical protein
MRPARMKAALALRRDIFLMAISMSVIIRPFSKN